MYKRAYTILTYTQHYCFTSISTISYHCSFIIYVLTLFNTRAVLEFLMMSTNLFDAIYFLIHTIQYSIQDTHTINTRYIGLLFSLFYWFSKQYSCYYTNIKWVLKYTSNMHNIHSHIGIVPCLRSKL